jgi:hypothetical protein
LFGWNMFFGICRYALSLCIFLCTHIMINVYNYIYVDIHGRYVCIYIYMIYIYIYLFIYLYVYICVKARGYPEIWSWACRLARMGWWKDVNQPL